MTYLGVDYGEKRIGLAKATDELKIATPFKTVPNDKNIFGTIRDVIIREQIGEIVLGVPVSFDGNEHEFAKKIRHFGQTLGKKLKIKVHLQNEILSTKEASRANPKDPDSSAAALILQTYLDSKV